MIFAFSTESELVLQLAEKRSSFLTIVTKFYSSEFSYSFNYVAFLYLIFKEIINIITDIEILRFISYQHFIWIILIPPIASFCYQLDGMFIGAAQTKEIRNAMIVSVIGFILASIYFTKNFGNHGLCFL